MSMSLNCAYAYDWHTTPDQWKEPRIFHSEFDKNYENRIRVSHAQSPRQSLEKNEKERNYSPNQAYWYVIHPPDTLKPGPWSTEIGVFSERDYRISIELTDHAATYPTTVKWINEKLLYIQLWWGRVLGTYFIFDVEMERIVIREMVHDGGIPFQQWQDHRQQ